jgi:hypothetical protein
VVIALSLLAALAFAVAAALKHASAGGVARLETMTLPAVGRFVRATMQHPLWWAGTAVDVVAVSLHVLALRVGALALVQPLLVSVLVFGLALRTVGERRVPGRQLGWAVGLSAALAGFLVVAGPTEPGPGADVDRISAVLVALVGVVVATACVVAARTHFSHGAAAAMYGVAAGIAYAASAALLKALTGVLPRGIAALAGSWQLYAVVVVGGLGVVLTQLAYQCGPLAASLPSITIVNPLLSIVIGVVVYDENMSPGLPSGVAMGALLSVLGWACYQLARSEDPSWTT